MRAGEDGVGGFGPDEGLRAGVGVDCGFEFVGLLEGATLQAFACQTPFHDGLNSLAVG